MLKKKDYQALVKKHAPKSPILKNCFFAFLAGGGICAFGQILCYLYTFLGVKEEDAYLLVTVSLIFISALLTGLGVFDTAAKHAGAGTLVPVTGFANSVVSPAIDNKSEGIILGVGAKIFTVCGPVILFCTLGGTLYGIFYYLLSLFL